MENIDVLAVDPGVATGLSFTTLRFSDNYKINPEAVHTTTINWPRDFSTDEQAEDCMAAWHEFSGWWSMWEQGNRAIWAFELFRLQPGKAHNSNAAGFSAMWVHAQFSIMSRLGLHPPKLLRFTPGASKGQCTDKRLKTAGLWVMGSPHERDANRILWMVARRLRNG